MNTSTLLLTILGASILLFVGVRSASPDNGEVDQPQIDSDPAEETVNETDIDDDDEDEDWEEDLAAKYSRSGLCGHKHCSHGKVCVKKCKSKCVDSTACDECTDRGDNFDNEVGDACNNNCNCARDLTCDFTGNPHDTTRRCRKRTTAEKLPVHNPKCANR